ncbi:DUF803-domain-containing protein, partial [Sistotremastrum suecicum HHB10207 ss-3]
MDTYPKALGSHSAIIQNFAGELRRRRRRQRITTKERAKKTETGHACNPPKRIYGTLTSLSTPSEFGAGLLVVTLAEPTPLALKLESDVSNVPDFIILSMSSSSASPSASAASSATAPHQYRVIGIVLAIASGLFIGTSFVLKKKGLLRSQKGHAAGEGVAYLKSPMWWSGMTLMILGELLNLGAYSFVEAILVTPLGALSVVICAILSHFFLKEKLSLFGWIGCTQCILGSVIIAMNAPNEQSVSTIAAFKKFFLAPWFLAYGSVLIAAALIVIFFIAPKYGTKSMLWYILVCSLFGGLSVSCTQALGASILTTIRGQNQFKNWFIYFLIAFVICTLLTELFFLNKALALFNTAMVTPTYYVMFTFCTLCTSIILYEGLKSSGAQIMTMVLGFCVICTGIFILQMSKVDPRQLTVDPKTSMLLQAARSEVEPAGAGEENDLEKEVKATEEPGMDALRGTLGAIGSVIR